MLIRITLQITCTMLCVSRAVQDKIASATRAHTCTHTLKLMQRVVACVYLHTSITCLDLNARWSICGFTPTSIAWTRESTVCHVSGDVHGASDAE